MNNNQEKESPQVSIPAVRTRQEIRKQIAEALAGIGATDEFLEQPMLVELPFGEGEIIKNYKEMCSLLEEKIRDGNAKKSQLNRWKKYFSWEKKGHKFIITDTKDNLFLTGDDNSLLSSNKAYIENIQKILLNYFHSQAKKGEFFSYLSVSLMIRLTNIVRPSFVRTKFSEFDKVIEYTKDVLKEEPEFAEFYFNRVYRTLRFDFDRAFAILENRKLIGYDRVMMVKPNLKYNHDDYTREELKGYGFTDAALLAFDNHWDRIDDKFEVISAQDDRSLHYDTVNELTKPREAEDFERLVILHVENMTMEILECQNMQQIFGRGLEQEFYKLRNEVIKDILGIEYIYSAYRVFFSPLILERMKQEDDERFVISDEQYTELQNSINEEFNNNIEDKFIEYWEKALNTDEDKKSNNQRVATNARTPRRSFKKLSQRYARISI